MADMSDTQDVPILGPTDSEPKIPDTCTVRVEYGAASHVGKVRTNNEVHFFIGRLGRSMKTLLTNLPEGTLPALFEQAAHVFIVADGMGGAAAGEVASAMAIATGIKMALNSPEWTLRVDDKEAHEISERALRYFEKIHEVVGQRAKSDRSLSGMGTTLTSAYSVGLDLFTFHVGDSRAYLFHDGKLKQLTRDHTVAQLLADAGRIPAQEAGKLGMKHVLTSAVGAGKEEISPDIGQVRLADGDRILLCTD